MPRITVRTAVANTLSLLFAAIYQSFRPVSYPVTSEIRHFLSAGRVKQHCAAILGVFWRLNIVNIVNVVLAVEDRTEYEGDSLEVARRTEAVRQAESIEFEQPQFYSRILAAER